MCDLWLLGLYAGIPEFVSNDIPVIDKVQVQIVGGNGGYDKLERFYKFLDAKLSSVRRNDAHWR